jgi:hypothetical protein
MEFTLAANPHSAKQRFFRDLVQKGLEAHGVKVYHALHRGEPIQTRCVACWSWVNGQRFRDQGHSVLVLERGYLGNRQAWTSLAWNGLNNRGTVPPVPDDGGERFDRFHAGLLQPWDPQGDYVLLIGQVADAMSVLDDDALHAWYLSQVQRPWDVPVRFRPHPHAHVISPVRDVPGAPVIEGDFKEVVRRARDVVTFNSSAAVDALLAGKRTEAFDAGSIAWPCIAGGMDRTTWAHRLAWRQWSFDELSSGLAFQHVGLGDADAAGTDDA